jgi:hypothetical protein
VGRIAAALVSVGFWLSLFGAVPLASGNSLFHQPETVGETIYQSQGKIDYAQFRQIGTGMTTAEVLKLCGPPMNSGGCLRLLSCFPSRWMYYRDDGWLVEVFFGKAGQVERVTSERQ